MIFDSVTVLTFTDMIKILFHSTAYFGHNKWYHRHMTGDRTKFHELDEKIAGLVKFGDGSTVKIHGKGSILFSKQEWGAKISAIGIFQSQFEKITSLVLDKCWAGKQSNTWRVTSQDIWSRVVDESEPLIKSCLQDNTGHMQTSVLAYEPGWSGMALALSS